MKFTMLFRISWASSRYRSIEIRNNIVNFSPKPNRQTNSKIELDSIGDLSYINLENNLNDTSLNDTLLNDTLLNDSHTWYFTFFFLFWFWFIFLDDTFTYNPNPNPYTIQYNSEYYIWYQSQSFNFMKTGWIFSNLTYDNYYYYYFKPLSGGEIGHHIENDDFWFVARRNPGYE